LIDRWLETETLPEPVAPPDFGVCVGCLQKLREADRENFLRIRSIGEAEDPEQLRKMYVSVMQSAQDDLLMVPPGDEQPTRRKREKLDTYHNRVSQWRDRKSRWETATRFFFGTDEESNLAVMAAALGLDVDVVRERAKKTVEESERLRVSGGRGRGAYGVAR
jgi:hypothetical protein